MDKNMNLLEAQKIVNEYGTVIEKAAVMGCGQAAPISMLPYPKEEIKTAIQICWLASMLTGEFTEQDILAFGYIYLAKFIDDDEAKIVIEYYKGIMELGEKAKELQRFSETGELIVESEKVKELARRFKGLDGEKSSAIRDRILQEMKFLQDEILSLRTLSHACLNSSKKEKDNKEKD